MNDIMRNAFIDEMAKIAMSSDLPDMEKEAIVQYLYGAGRALGALGQAGARMARTGWQAGRQAMQAGGGFGEALQKGWQAAGGKSGVLGQFGRGAQRGWKAGVGRMEQFGQLGGTPTSWTQQQGRMLSALKPGTGKPIGARYQDALRQTIGK